jgi:hypothetical protein
MDPAVQLRAALRPGEQLLWGGRPDPRVWFTPADAFLVPFSVLWCAFVVFWEWDAAGGPLLGGLLGLPFIAVGLHLLLGRFIYKRHRKKRIAYGITTQRAVIAAPRLLADRPLQHQPVTARRSRDSRHVSVVIGNALTAGGAFGGSQALSWYYANTGLEPFARNRGLPFAFYDVADADAMLLALDQARSQPTG